MTEYQKPAKWHRTELIVKHSRFITTIAPTADKPEAQAFINQIRVEHTSASHNCWAQVAGCPADIQTKGCSDDGEPKGTAGRPMLGLLEHSGIGDITAVVTRYFGGTKLGTGGLVRAYSQALRECLDSLPLEIVIPMQALQLRAGFEMTGQLEHLIDQFSLHVHERIWQDKLIVNADIEQTLLPAFELALQPYRSITFSRCE
ncbi:MAG: YigZ family protein [Pontibacterium sp.]